MHKIGTIRARLFLLAIALPACFALAQAAQPGEAAPGFQLPQIDGSARLDLQEFRGRVTYVDFWASWCGPCRQSMPLYESLQAEFSREDFAIVAINVDEFQADAEQFLAAHPVSYTVLMDPSGDTASRWQIKVMPSSFLLDDKGKIIKAYAGFEPEHIETIRHDIQTLIN